MSQGAHAGANNCRDCGFFGGWDAAPDEWGRRGVRNFIERCRGAGAQAPETAGGEANLKLPDLSPVKFLGVDGHTLLLFGILFCVFGLAFGMTIYTQLKNLPVHRAMREISELIYETCKTYLITQGKFLLLL